MTTSLDDSEEADGFLYYVMPFIGGETLRLFTLATDLRKTVVRWLKKNYPALCPADIKP